MPLGLNIILIITIPLITWIITKSFVATGAIFLVITLNVIFDTITSHSNYLSDKELEELRKEHTYNPKTDAFK